MTIPASTLTLELRCCRQLLVLLSVSHLLACASLLLLDIAWHWRLLAWLALAVHAVFVWYDTAWIRNLRCLRFAPGDAGVELVYHDGPVPVDAGALVTPWLIVLPMRIGGRRRRLPLLSGCCAPDDLRRLRVLLRCYGAGRTACD